MLWESTGSDNFLPTHSLSLPCAPTSLLFLSVSLLYINCYTKFHIIVFCVWSCLQLNAGRGISHNHIIEKLKKYQEMVSTMISPVPGSVLFYFRHSVLNLDT